MAGLEISGRLLARNSLLNFIGQALPLCVTIVAIPFIIRALGVERFGLLSIAWVVLEYFIIFDCGLGRASAKYVAEALGNDDQDQISRIAWTTLMVQLGFGLVGTAVVFGVTPLLVEHIFNISPALTAEAKVMFSLIAMAVPLVLASSSLTGMLAAAQRFDLVNAVNALSSVANSFAILVGVLYLGWQLTHLVMVLVVVRGLGLITNYWLCTRIFSTLTGLPQFRLAELNKLLSFGGWVTVSSMVVPLLLYMDRFVIGATLTMTAVAYYSVPYDIVTRLWIIPLSLITALYPAFSTVKGQGRGEQLAPLMAQSMKWVLLTLGPIVVLISAFASDILRLWLGLDFARESTIAFQILLVAILINSMVQVPYTLVQALGRPDLTAKFHLIQLPFHGVLVWLLVSRWGVMGAAIAQAIRITLEALLLLVAGCRLASLPFGSFVADRTVQTLLLIFLCTALAIGVSNLSIVMWLRLLALAIILSAVTGTVWRYSLKDQDRGEVAKLFGR